MFCGRTKIQPEGIIVSPCSAACASSAQFTDIAIRQNASASLPDNGPERIVRRARVTCDKNYACTVRFLTPEEAKAAGASLTD